MNARGMDYLRDNNLPARYIVIGFGLAATAAVVRGLVNTPDAKARRAGAKLPPGPKREHFIGNLRNFPERKWQETFTKWKSRFGDIIYVDVMGTPMLILNSLEAAQDLLEKRGDIYSSRPYTIMMNKLMYYDWWMILAPPGHAHTEQRKVLQKVMGPKAVPTYDVFVQDQSVKLVEELSGFSGDPLPRITKSIGSVIFRISYGNKMFEEHGEELTLANKKRAELSAWTYPRVWLVNFLPFLQYVPSWFPGATFRRIGLESTRLSSKVRFWIFELIEKDVASGIADESVAAQFISDHETPREHLRDALAVLYGGGLETTSNAINNLLYMLMLHPNIQRRVQDELDEQVGDGRLPTMKDIKKMTYFNATWNESLRFNVVTPLGVPHVNTEPDVYKGYYIPKGCTIYANLGYILRDPKIWGDDADTYNPDRFLPECNPRAAELPDISMIPFGFGKRICPGRYLAERTALLFTASILSAYDILPADGRKNVAPLEFTEGMIVRLVGFQCRFVPRR
ncbi:cytochrome P450 [Serendipita vermifera]|nr:cytochrome P450 [Serendipita vermifera]